jgi:hypothetical protein
MHGQADTPLPPNSADGRWYAYVGGKNYGPYVRRDIERMVQSGQIRGTDFLCIVGGSAWVQADTAPEFRALFQTRPPLALSARAPDPSKVYKARRALQLRRGLIVIAIGLLGFLSLRHIADWLAGGPKPEPERFFVLAFLLLLPIGAFRLFNALRGLLHLTVTRQGLKLDMGLRTKTANWDSLEPFAIRIVGTGPLGKRLRIATATIIGPNAGKGLLRRKTFRISDIFVEPIGAIVAQLNAARAEALGIPDTAPVAEVEPEQAAVGLADFKLPWLTLALLAVLVAVFALEIRFAAQSSSSLSLGPATLFVFGGLTRAAVLSGGEWYRLFTAPLLHANLPHIVGNRRGFAVGRLAARAAGRAAVVFLLLCRRRPWRIAALARGDAGQNDFGRRLGRADGTVRSAVRRQLSPRIGIGRPRPAAGEFVARPHTVAAAAVLVDFDRSYRLRRAFRRRAERSRHGGAAAQALAADGPPAAIAAGRYRYCSRRRYSVRRQRRRRHRQVFEIRPHAHPARRTAKDRGRPSGLRHRSHGAVSGRSALGRSGGGFAGRQRALWRANHPTMNGRSPRGFRHEQAAQQDPSVIGA